MVVVLVGAQVLRQRLDPLGQERDLYLGGAGIAIVRGVVVNDGALRVSGERHVFLHFSFHYSGASYQTDGSSAPWEAPSCSREGSPAGLDVPPHLLDQGVDIGKSLLVAEPPDDLDAQNRAV